MNHKDVQKVVKNLIPIALSAAMLILLGYMAYQFGYNGDTIGALRIKPGQVWVYYPKQDDPFREPEEADTMTVLAVSKKYVQFNSSKDKDLNPRSRKASSFLYEAERIK